MKEVLNKHSQTLTIHNMHLPLKYDIYHKMKEVLNKHSQTLTIHNIRLPLSLTPCNITNLQAIEETLTLVLKLLQVSHNIN